MTGEWVKGRQKNSALTSQSKTELYIYYGTLPRCHMTPVETRHRSSRHRALGWSDLAACWPGHHSQHQRSRHCRPLPQTPRMPPVISKDNYSSYTYSRQKYNYRQTLAKRKRYLTTCSLYNFSQKSTFISNLRYQEENILLLIPMVFSVIFVSCCRIQNVAASTKLWKASPHHV
jgi:hypothetical protein